jgi:membrane-associated phospholipid phosphatase
MPLRSEPVSYGVPVRGRTSAVVAWLLVLAAGQVAAFELVRRVFVGTVRGQQIDAIALAGNAIGSSRVAGVVSTVLNAVSVLSVLAAIVVIGFIALMRRRLLLAVVATVMIIGANVTTQVLKAVSVRPDLGVDLERVMAGNSLPSGHTTVTASVAVALVLVLPSQVRGVAALIGAAVAGIVGVATVSAGWHRPSDAAAALLVVGAWAALAGLVLVLVHRSRQLRGGKGAGPDDGAHRMAVTTLAMVGALLLALAVAALALTDGVRDIPPQALSRPRLLVAYAGGAAGIVGVTCAVKALVLGSVHLVVPTTRAAVSPSSRR